MAIVSADWEKKVSELWTELDRYDGDDFVVHIEEFAAELPSGSAIGRFERGAALDSTGHPDRADPLYSTALDAG